MSMTSESNAAQLDLIQEIVTLSQAAGLRAWLLGGWGIDALCGKVRREHHDIDLITRLEWRNELRAVVRELAGSIAEDTPQKLRFVANGIRCDAVFFHTDSQGLLVSDLIATDPLVYPWPPDSFPARFNGSLGGVDCWAISWAAQFVAKEGYKNVEPESTLREKDRVDLRTIREHIPASEQEELRRFLPGVPRDNTVQPCTSALSVPLSASRPTVRGQRRPSAGTPVQRSLHCRAQRSTVAHRQPAELSPNLPCLADARQAVKELNHCARTKRSRQS